MIRPLKMRWILTCAVAGFLLAVTPASAQDYEALRHAAEQGDARAQHDLGVGYATGEGVPQDDAEAVRWYRLAAEQGLAESQVNLGGMYDNGRGVPQDNAEAVRWYRLAAEQGDATAQYNLGQSYTTGEGVPQDDAEAVRWFRLAAEQGYADAQNNLGGMYTTGEGVPQDDAEAVRWFRLAAEQGHAESQFNLGVVYATGKGVPQDDAEAVRWFRLAADQGHATAQYNLGFIYENGEGVPLDYAEAERWYRLAAAQGDASAQLNLGVMYATGEGVPQDDAEAVRWYRLAAAQGNATAQGNLRAMSAAGRGVPQNDAEAVPDTTLHGLQLSEGPPEPGFFFSAMAGQLPDGNVTLTPAFDPGSTTYHAEVSQPLLTIRARAAASGNITATGVTADGSALPTGNQTQITNVNDHGAFLSVTFSELAVGENRIQIASPAGTAYTIVVTRSASEDDAEAVSYTTLHGLQLSEGPPEPGFFFSAMAGQLPDGNVTLTPAFDPGSTTYHTEVSQPLLTVRARAAVSVNITATGVTADGEELPAGNQTRVNSNGAFLSVTFSELAMGENRIQIALSPAGTAYTIVVTRVSA